MDVDPASVSYATHKLRCAGSNVRDIMHDGRVAKARRQVEPVDKENVVRITMQVLCVINVFAHNLFNNERGKCFTVETENLMMEASSDVFKR
jgi:hypothetical protein